MKYSIGIMQGRLTEPKGRGIQFFPFDNWEKEFALASQIGIKEIEFIFDYDKYELNPLWIEGGKYLEEVIKESGVQVKKVCFDYFMRRPFYKYRGDTRKEILNENEVVLERVLENMHNIGINLIEIPLVDNSSLKSDDEKENFLDFLKKNVKKNFGEIRYGLETDLSPLEFRKYLEEFNDIHIGANYDSGNSSGIGYDPYEEITTLNDYIFNVHIKDRIFHGTTVELGTGSADFEKIFMALSKIDYKNDFILQAAREQEGDELKTIKKQKQFLENYINKYLVNG